jgi:hypothetical protein
MKQCFAQSNAGALPNAFDSGGGGSEGHTDTVLANNLWRFSCQDTKRVLRIIKDALQNEPASCLCSLEIDWESS